MADQSECFASGEGDAWFQRNQLALESYSDDPVIAMARAHIRAEPNTKTVCELGCANGWRLAALGAEETGLHRLVGADVSENAIADGQARWPGLELKVAPIDNPELAQTFDLVLVSFVLHWVARERLAASLAAIDALVRDGGALLIADFLPDRPCARAYHHRNDIEIFTFKQDYAACFTGLAYYEIVEKVIYSADDANITTDEQNRASTTMLRKNFSLYRKVD